MERKRKKIFMLCVCVYTHVQIYIYNISSIQQQQQHKSNICCHLLYIFIIIVVFQKKKINERFKIILYIWIYFEYLIFFFKEFGTTTTTKIFKWNILTKNFSLFFFKKEINCGKKRWRRRKNKESVKLEENVKKK